MSMEPRSTIVYLSGLNNAKTGSPVPPTGRSHWMLGLMFTLAWPCFGQGSLEHIKVRRIRTKAELAAPRTPGTVLVAVRLADVHGHIVVGSSTGDSVYDGNILGEFQELAAGQVSTDLRRAQRVVNRWCKYENAPIAAKASREQAADWLERYRKEGSSIRDSFDPRDGIAPDSVPPDGHPVMYFEVTGDPKTVKYAVMHFVPTGDANRRCNILALSAVPAIDHLVRSNVP